jgi:hypothetical protein
MATTPNVGDYGLMVLHTPRGLETRDIFVTAKSSDGVTITVRFPLSPGLGSTGFGLLELSKVNNNVWARKEKMSSEDNDIFKEYMLFGSDAEEERLSIAQLAGHFNPLVVHSLNRTVSLRQHNKE